MLDAPHDSYNGNHRSLYNLEEDHTVTYRYHNLTEFGFIIMFYQLPVNELHEFYFEKWIFIELKELTGTIDTRF